MKELNWGGLILVAIGLFFLVVQGGVIGPEAIVLVVGAGFLTAYYAGRRSQFGFLVPGCIVSGVGLGVILITSRFYPPLEGTLMLFSIAAGFFGISLLAPDHPRWPLIPAGVLACVALIAGADSVPVFSQLRRFIVPAVLITLGLVIVLRSGTRKV